MNWKILFTILTVTIISSTFAQKKDIKVEEYKYDVEADPDTMLDPSLSFQCSLSKNSFESHKYLLLRGIDKNAFSKGKMMVDGEFQFFKEANREDYLKELESFKFSEILENGKYILKIKFNSKTSATILIIRKSDSYKKSIKVYGWFGGDE